MTLRGDELQLGRGESIADTARVLSRYLHAIVVRWQEHDPVAELAAASEVPVVNALTPLHHPCQALADLLTLRERLGGLDGVSVAYVGDGNNVARSLAILGRTAGVEVRVATPEGYELEPGLAALDTHDPREAAAGADALYTDVWVSMGDEPDADRRRADLAPYQLNDELLSLASERAIVLHCLPAHPGEEITECAALRRALGGLGPGREPPSHREGTAGDAGRLIRIGVARRASRLLDWRSPGPVV